MRSRKGGEKGSRKKTDDIEIISEKSNNDADAAYGTNGIDWKIDSERCEGIAGRTGTFE